MYVSSTPLVVLPCVTDWSRADVDNEELRDLLNTSVEKPKLRLQEDVNHTVVCKGLEEHSVNTVEVCMDLLRRGSRERQTAATFSNHNSSRSHSIFTFKLLVRETVAVGEEVIKTGQLNLVDLAGSECIGISGSRGDMAVEAGNINKSLLTLGRVISALVDVQPHIPYRDSKLTRLLQDSLGGRAKTSIIATVSPSVVSLEESLSTLDYAARARFVKNQPTINSTSQAKHVMKDLHYELESMRSQLQIARDKNGVYMDPREYEDLMNKLAAQTLALQEAETTIAVRDQEMKVLQDRQQDFLDQIAALTKQNEALTLQVRRLVEENAALGQRLGAMYVHTQTQRQIVVEQAQTETRLRAQAEALQTALQARELDVERLLARVQALEAQEAARQQQGQALATHVSQGQDELQRQIAQLQETSSTHQSHVQDLLQHLQRQSAAWQEQAAAAFQTLLVDKLQTQLLQGDFGALDAQLRQTMPAALATYAADVTRTVDELAQQWQGWLGAGVAQVAALQSQLESQAGHLAATQSFVQTQSQELQTLVATWRQAQQSRAQEATQAAGRYASEMDAHVTTSRAAVAAQTQAAQAQFAQQLSQFQSQVAAMFGEIAQQYSGLCAAVVQTTDAQHGASQQLATTHADTWRALVAQEHHAQVVASLETLDAWRADHTTQVLDAARLGGAVAVRDALAQRDLPALATHLATQRDTVVPQQQAAVQSGVSAWSQGAAQALQTATAQLATATTHATELQSELTLQRDTQQEALGALLRTHQDGVDKEVFSTQEQFLALSEAQTGVVAAARQHVDAFATQLRTDLAPHRGDTPLHFAASEDVVFTATRPMDEIVEAVVADFVEHDQSDASWRAVLTRDDVAPRDLQALPAIVARLTKTALANSSDPQ
jgi:kinesin family protein 11